MEDFSIIMPVFKESDNARLLLKRFQDNDCEDLKEVVTVIDGEKLESDWSKAHIIENSERLGKAQAINQGLEAIDTDVVILLSSDIDISFSTVKRMVEEISGGADLVVPRIEPMDGDQPSLSIEDTIWKLHHYISLEEPKAGEALGFRPGVYLPKDTVTDEEYIASNVEEKHYLADELIFNRPPASLKQLYLRRRRIFNGHLQLMRTRNYSAPTNRAPLLLNAAKRYLLDGGKPDKLAKLVLLETFARSEGFIRALIGHRPWKWKKVATVPGVDR
ncbi:MAG: glycosyltransferase family 2 protein [Candidatus Nanohaloarchaea archaeon]